MSVRLYPETGEPVNILNIKRGIISAVLVPVMEDSQNSLMVSIFSQPKLASLQERKSVYNDDIMR